MTPTSKTVEEQEVLLEFARFSGPGTRMYPSPRPADVQDLTLPPMRWIQIDPAYKKSGIFTRDKKNKVFEVIESDVSPDDIDLSIPERLDQSLTPDQREFIRSLVTTISPTIKAQIKQAIEISNLITDAGLPVSNDVSVTLDYLRTRHRPFLMALQAVEKRFQKRKVLLTMIQKQLDRIESLPGR